MMTHRRDDDSARSWRRRRLMTVTQSLSSVDVPPPRSTLSYHCLPPIPRPRVPGSCRPRRREGRPAPRGWSVGPRQPARPRKTTAPPSRPCRWALDRTGSCWRPRPPSSRSSLASTSASSVPPRRNRKSRDLRRKWYGVAAAARPRPSVPWRGFSAALCRSRLTIAHQPQLLYCIIIPYLPYYLNLPHLAIKGTINLIIINFTDSFDVRQLTAITRVYRLHVKITNVAHPRQYQKDQRQYNVTVIAVADALNV